MKSLFILLDTIQQAIPVVRVILPQEEKYIYDSNWFNTIVGVAFGIIGTVIGFYLTASRDNKIRKREEIKEQLKILREIHAEASSIRPTLFSFLKDYMTSFIFISGFDYHIDNYTHDLSGIDVNLERQTYNQIKPMALEKHTRLIYLLSQFEGLIPPDKEFNTNLNSISTFDFEVFFNLGEKIREEPSSAVEEADERRSNFMTMVALSLLMMDGHIGQLENVHKNEKNRAQQK